MIKHTKSKKNIIQNAEESDDALEDVNEGEEELSLDKNGDVHNESEDDITEELEEEEKNTRKRQNSENGDDIQNLPNQKKKRKGNKNVKPPTAEEMMNLRETENLYLSNIFRLQIVEMLSELKPKKSIKKFTGPWIDSLKTFLMKLNGSDSYDLFDMKWLKKLKVCLPLKTKNAEEGKGIFLFKPPVDLLTIGSHALGCPLGPTYAVDIALVMPKEFISKQDHLNERYFLKRALYLCYIAGQLKNSELLSSEHNIEFTYLSDDPSKPILVLHPSGKLANLITVRLHPALVEKAFPFKRLLPSKNNVRSDYWQLEKDILPATPIYNANILEDMVLIPNHSLKKEIFDQNQSFKDAFILLRVWLKQRELGQGLGSFNSHITAMLLVYLLKKQKINKYMSSYQIIRHVWLYLADSDWTEDGPTLCEVKQEDGLDKEDFHIYYDVVFVDTTGFFNLATRLNKFVYNQVKEESKLAVKFLDNQEINGFKALFMSRMPFIRQYDITICFNDAAEMRKVVDSHGDKVNLMDHTNNVVPEFVKLVTELLEKGIGHRLSSIGLKTSEFGVWDVSSSFPDPGLVYFGLSLNPLTAFKTLDLGPNADEPAAKEFREFWGPKCDLRRFKDGSVCETIQWGSNAANLQKRRLINNRIINTLLTSKLGIHSYHNVCSFFQKVIYLNTSFKFCHEEKCHKIIQAYEDLCNKLRDLADIPLSITSVQCISPVFRFTDPFPPSEPFYIKNIHQLVDDPFKGRIFPESSKVGKLPPQFIAPVDCVVQMELTQKWPEDVRAGRRLIAAFNIAIAKALKKQCNLSCQVTADSIIVNKNGYMFRLFLGYSKEIGLLKLKMSEEGVRQYRDTPESLALEKKFINLPQISGALYKLSEENIGFGAACRLAKYWFASQLLDDTHFPQMLIELLMAYTFLSSQPYKPCVQILPAFLRFLSFISTTDWSLVPVIVNFNSILTIEDIKEIESAFQEDRKLFPPLFLVTPYDRTGSLWSKSAPTLPTLIRLTKLAAASLHILEDAVLQYNKFSNILGIFKPPMVVYDAVITLRKQFQLRKEESFFEPDNKYLNRKPCTVSILPILEFNPTDKFISDLRDNYGSFALFFHNPLGGIKIGVLFKPDYLKSVKFQSTLIAGRMPVREDGQIFLKPHLDSICEGFKILGNGIVESIKLKD